MRICYQSFLEPKAHPDYFAQLDAVLGAAKAKHVEFEIRGLSLPSMSPGRLTEFRCSALMLADLFQVPSGYYDAVVLGHFQDTGLYELRSSLDIPVIGMGEAAMHHACQLGSSIALVTIDPLFVPIHYEQVRRYGLTSRVINIVSMSLGVNDLVAGFRDSMAKQRALAQFRNHAEISVQMGAEVIIPAGGLFGALTAFERDFTVDGALVLNPLVVAVKYAELAAELRTFNGTMTSRKATFARTESAAIEEFLSIPQHFSKTILNRGLDDHL
jgi:Asp/Glu/hydantoin racemase